MGWAAGSALAEKIWEIIKGHIPEHEKQNTASQIVDAFEYEDCDTMEEAEELYLVSTTGLSFLKSNYDWQEAFEYAENFTREDVAEVIHQHNGENDEEPWVAVFRLKDGRFAGLSAWCDYTGWD